MVCPKCNTAIDEETVFCGNCGTQVAPLYARGATVIEATEKMPPNRIPSDPFGGSVRPQPAAFSPASMSPAQFPPLTRSERIEAERAAPTVFTPAPARPRRLHVKRAIFLASVLLLLLIGVSVGAVALMRNNSGTGSTAGATNKTTGGAAAPGAVTALVSFIDGAEGQTSALKISVVGLNAPATGTHYAAWLTDEQNERMLPLGNLTAQGKVFALSFAGNNANLLEQGNKVIITQEQGTASLPSGNVVLSGSFPPQAFVHIKHLLVAFPTTPGHIGLLVGLREQARLLNVQALLLKSAAANGNREAVRCASQSMLDVIEGKNGQNMNPLWQACFNFSINATGDGFGLLGQNGYVATAANHASLAATQPDSTDTIKVHANHVIIATENIKGWLTTIDQDVQHMLNNPGDTGKIHEIMTLSDHVLNGVDTNGDESIDPVPGEAGATTAYIHGQLMAGLSLHP